MSCSRRRVHQSLLDLLYTSFFVLFIAGCSSKRAISSIGSDEDLDPGGTVLQESLKEEMGPLDYEEVARLKHHLSAADKRAASGSHAASVKAGSHDDNEEFPFYRDFCKRNAHLEIPYTWDLSERYVIRVVHEDSSPVFNAAIALEDKEGRIVFSATTQASGEIILLPLMDCGPDYRGIERYTLRVGRDAPRGITPRSDGSIEYVLASDRDPEQEVSVQICFLIDATGSMGDEIRQLQDVIFSIHSGIASLPAKPAVSFSIVSYRDRKDRYLVKGSDFTAEIDTFQLALESLQARGGGDYPEDVEAGLHHCLRELSWDNDAVKFVFLIADAPPHLDRKKENYLSAARQFREMGAMVCPIGASGLTIEGEFVFRQIAVLTNGVFVFLHYGEQGESDGSGTAADPGKVSHHTGSNYTARRLDQIVLDIIGDELGYLTPAHLVKHTPLDPLERADLLELRLVSLLRQVFQDKRMGALTCAVGPIVSSDTTLADLSRYLYELALEKIPSVAEVSLIERTRLEDVLKEQALSLSGATESEGGRNLGKLLDADCLLISELHFLGTLRVCHMRLVECASGRVLGAGRVKL